jgi:hypothetical protein
MKFFLSGKLVHSLLAFLLHVQHNTDFFDLSAGYDGWGGGGQDIKLAGEEEEQHLEDGGPWFQQERMRMLAGWLQHVSGT